MGHGIRSEGISQMLVCMNSFPSPRLSLLNLASLAIFYFFLLTFFPLTKKQMTRLNLISAAEWWRSVWSPALLVSPSRIFSRRGGSASPTRFFCAQGGFLRHVLRGQLSVWVRWKQRGLGFTVSLRTGCVCVWGGEGGHSCVTGQSQSGGGGGGGAVTHPAAQLVYVHCHSRHNVASNLSEESHLNLITVQYGACWDATDR